MNKFTQLGSILTTPFEVPRAVKKGKEMIAGIWNARSCWLSKIARAVAGREEENHEWFNVF
jgi:hypothetical protein